MWCTRAGCRAASRPRQAGVRCSPRHYSSGKETMDMKIKPDFLCAVAVLCMLVCAQTARAAESGTLLKADELKAEPFRDAKTVKPLAKGEKVDIVSKDGGWFKVKAGKSSGWVRMLSVRKGAAAKAGSDASGLLDLASGRAGKGKVVASTG